MSANDGARVTSFDVSGARSRDFPLVRAEEVEPGAVCLNIDSECTALNSGIRRLPDEALAALAGGDQAFAVLVRASQHTNTKLVEVAEYLVHSGALPRGR